MNNGKLEVIEGKVCSKCGEWKLLEEYYKRKGGKDGRRSECKECLKEHRKANRERIKEQRKQYYQNNKEYIKERNKQYYQNNKEYYKQHYQDNKEHYKEYGKQYRENNEEHIKERNKQYRENNKEYKKEYMKQYRENNKELIKERKKQYYQNNKEYCREYGKQNYENNKQNNLQYISSLLDQINPTFNQLNLPIYGYIYRFENIKTGHVYIGQTIQLLKRRYGSNIIQGWIKERKERTNQKFKEELAEADFIVTETLDVAFCQYHLDKLEAYYINKYDSFLNGYNNREGNYVTDDGIEEFNQILSDHNLEFKDGKLIQIKSTHQDR